jgi:GNAT superfamily N-acetyltransferase
MAIQTVRDRHPDVLLGAREDSRSITLDKLIVPGGSRGRGLGSALMRDLVTYADRHGKQVRLTPSGAFGGVPRRLARFYARFGFVPNEGAQRDPGCGESMYRDPVRRSGGSSPPGRSRSPGSAAGRARRRRR